MAAQHSVEPILRPILRIVVGVDREGLADPAILAGLQLGAGVDARVELVHVVPALPELWPGLDPAESIERNDTLLERAQRFALEHVVEALRGTKFERRPLDEHLRILQGRPGPTLVAEARKLPQALILLGARHHRGLLHFGGTMRTALLQGPIAVWVQSTPPRKLASILAPIDFSEVSLHALAHARALAKRLAARVRVVHVFDPSFLVGEAWTDPSVLPVGSSLDLRKPDKENFERIVETFDWQDVPHDREFVEGYPALRILELADAHDLVVLGTHGHGGVATALLGSTSWSVLASCEQPVMVVRPPVASGESGD
jgi:nucleotide-binding universal stress UspA family protein